MTRITAIQQTAQLLGVDIRLIKTASNRTPYTDYELLLARPGWPTEILGRGPAWAHAYADTVRRTKKGLIGPELTESEGARGNGKA